MEEGRGWWRRGGGGEEVVEERRRGEEVVEERRRGEEEVAEGEGGLHHSATEYERQSLHSCPCAYENNLFMNKHSR